MISIVFLTNGGKSVTAPDNSNLLRVSLRQQGGIPFKCGAGICGTCRCKVERGIENTDKVKPKERKHLSDADVAAGYRMACQTFIEQGEVEVSWIPPHERAPGTPGYAPLRASAAAAPAEPPAPAPVAPAAMSAPAAPAARPIAAAVATAAAREAEPTPAPTVVSAPNVISMKREATMQASSLNYVAGEWHPAADSAIFEDRNPADERDLIATFPDSGTADVTAAVNALQKGWPAWWAASPEVRADVLFKAADIMARRADEIADELTREEGKTRAEARAEARRIAANFRLYAGEALRLNGETFPGEANQIVLSLRQPVGVVAVITPWNFPLSMAARKIAPALAAGNAVIFKPSEITPLMGQRLVEVLLEAGLPKDVIALVHGRGAKVGKAITASAIDALTFTGSYAVGRQIAAALSTDVRAQLEMGGKNATIVLADADIDKAVGIIERGAFGLTGQACTGTSRVLVARPLYEPMVAKLAAAAGKIKVGPGAEDGVRMGPLATSAQYDKVRSYIEIARAEGSRIDVGGEFLRGNGDARLANGNFMSPAVISEVPASSRLLREEIFGPVVAVRAVEDAEEAMAIADETEYGLAVSLVTNDLNAVIRFARGTRHGIVKVNAPTTGVSLNAPFGGFKHSSNQAAKEQGGANVMDFYTRIKTVYLGG
ncbi:MAG TPA: aldehyde dehydrogenase family protein [Bauldia sp.]|nr:aldehyde dehydrogenase family protein [Bauldia sp.]